MPTKIKWLIVAGARPNFMKIAPIVKAIDKYNDNIIDDQPAIEPLLVHTGQHYDRAMSKIFFEELGIPKPDINLGIGSGNHGEQTGRIMIEFEKVVLKHKPDLLIVVGDVNSTMACSIVAVKLGVKVAHVEAGLRSYDRTMPEEINRIVTDSISDYLLTSCDDGEVNLLKEGISKEKNHFVGNVMVDTLLAHRDKADKSNIHETLGLSENGKIQDYALLTLHRPSNVDDKETFKRILEPINKISEKMPVIFAAHLRTQKQIKSFGLQKFFNLNKTSIKSKGIYLLDPMGYLDFLKLMSHSKLIFSDSGGIQEETTILGVPCLTLRENTERPVTITEGTNVLVGVDPEKILASAIEMLNGENKTGSIPFLWDGKAAVRLVNILASAFHEN